MKINYRVSEDDFVEANRALYKANKRGRVTRYGIIGVGIVLALLPFWTPPAGDPLPFAFVPLGLFVAWTGIGPILLLNWCARQSYKKQPALLEDCDAEITEDGISSTTATTRNQLNWTAFSKAVESQNIFMLFRGILLYIFPKRGFAAGEAESFRELLQRKIPKPTR